ncbi:MAG: hypothetical protein IPH28_15625 [Cytophagaceae bacterium]|nr:hypothetical protein [Cytophagaceae bacterium]
MIFHGHYDRDIAIHTKVIQNQLNKEVVSISYAEANAVPKLKNYVRIDEFTSQNGFLNLMAVWFKANMFLGQTLGVIFQHGW